MKKEILSQPKISNQNYQDFNSFTRYDRIDFSGYDIKDNNFISKDFEESIFNGASFVNITDNGSNFKHVEFSEASFINCRFISSDISHSDFVLASFEYVIFEDCLFTNGEWRESKFKNCEFINCQFQNTTVNLCIFTGCHFDIVSSKSFIGISKKYNLFACTEFSLELEHISFIEYNFGIQSQVKQLGISQYENSNILFLMSLLEYSSQLNNVKFVDYVIEGFQILLSSSTKNYQSIVRYIINIIKYFADNRLTIFQLSYLLEQLTHAIKYSTNQIIFLELIQLVTLLRQTLLSLHDRKRIEIERYGMQSLAGMEQINFEIVFEHCYTEAQIRNLFSALALFSHCEQVTIESVRAGSTFVNGLTKKVFEFSGIVTALTFALQNLEVAVDATVDTYTHIVEKVDKTKTLDRHNKKELSILDEKKSNELKQFQESSINVFKDNKIITEIDGNAKLTIS